MLGKLWMAIMTISMFWICVWGTQNVGIKALAIAFFIINVGLYYHFTHRSERRRLSNYGS
jgi:uncharacterized membrane protein